MQRAWYQRLVKYDPEWRKSVRLQRKPVEFDLSRFSVPIYNHYVMGDDVCDVNVNRRAISPAGGDNKYLSDTLVEHSSIQRNNSDDVYETLLESLNCNH